jgi:hypothetical protein
MLEEAVLVRPAEYVTWLSPLQALARVVMFKAMPSDELLLECKAQSAAHFFKQVP